MFLSLPYLILISSQQLSIVVGTLLRHLSDCEMMYKTEEEDCPCVSVEVLNIIISSASVSGVNMTEFACARSPRQTFVTQEDKLWSDLPSKFCSQNNLLCPRLGSNDAISKDRRVYMVQTWTRRLYKTLSLQRLQHAILLSLSSQVEELRDINSQTYKG